MTDGRFFHVVAVTDNQNPLHRFYYTVTLLPTNNTFRITAAVIHLNVIIFRLAVWTLRLQAEQNKVHINASKPRVLN